MDVPQGTLSIAPWLLACTRKHSLPWCFALSILTVNSPNSFPVSDTVTKLSSNKTCLKSSSSVSRQKLSYEDNHKCNFGLKRQIPWKFISNPKLRWIVLTNHFKEVDSSLTGFRRWFNATFIVFGTRVCGCLCHWTHLTTIQSQKSINQTIFTSVTGRHLIMN